MRANGSFYAILPPESLGEGAGIADMLRMVAKLRRRTWRSASALVLLLGFLLPFLTAAQSLVTDPEAALPACCRSHGKHKCSMVHLHVASDHHGHSVSTPHISEKCPCNVPSAPTLFGDHHARPVGIVQLRLEPRQSAVEGESKSRNAFALFSANRQRGPPISSNFA